jgi:hypothetical protein
MGMNPPPADMLTTVGDFVAYNGGSGIYRPSAVQDALAMAESEVERWLNTTLTPQPQVDEFDWPVDHHRMYLRKVRLISVESVEGLFPNGDCTWQTSSECWTILDNRESIIRIRDPWRLWCSGLRCPERMRVHYTAGFQTSETDPALTKRGVKIRSAIFTVALGMLQTGIGLNAQGNLFIQSYTAAGYNESRKLPEMSGAVNMMNQHILMGKELAREAEVKRAIMFRSRGVGRPC